MMIPDSNVVLMVVIPAAVAAVVTLTAIATSKLRQVRVRRRRLESGDRLELTTHAAAAIDTAAASLKKMLEALPGTSAAFTGRAAGVAIDATARAILAIVADMPTRMQRAEESIRRNEQGLKEMRELFNRLGK